MANHGAHDGPAAGVASSHVSEPIGDLSVAPAESYLDIRLLLKTQGGDLTSAVCCHSGVYSLRPASA
jgi:hypothetical protein